MIQPSDPKDSQWLDALAGKPDPAASPGINSQAAALRKALRERSRAMDQRVPMPSSAQYQQILFRLQREGLRGGRTFGWKTLTVFVTTAFAIGAASTGVIMLPAMQAFRSSGPITDIAGTNGYAQTVTIRVQEPARTVQVVTSEAIRLGLAVAVDSDPSGHRILISGFVPYSPDQETLRDALGINKSASGKLLFLVVKKTAQ